MKKLRDKQGWDGWCGGILYSSNLTGDALDAALKQQAVDTSNGLSGCAAVVTKEGDIYGWGYTSEKYKDGPEFWPVSLLQSRMS